MNDDDETDFLDGYTDDELLQLQEFIADILDQDPDAEIEWVEYDAEDDNLDFTYEHAGVTLH